MDEARCPACFTAMDLAVSAPCASCGLWWVRPHARDEAVRAEVIDADRDHAVAFSLAAPSGCAVAFATPLAVYGLGAVALLAWTIEGATTALRGFMYGVGGWSRGDIALDDGSLRTVLLRSWQNNTRRMLGLHASGLALDLGWCGSREEALVKARTLARWLASTRATEVVSSDGGAARFACPGLKSGAGLTLKPALRAGFALFHPLGSLYVVQTPVRSPRLARA